MISSKSAVGALTAVSGLMFATGAQADLLISFNEGAPKDAFKIENAGTCTLSNSSILVDLSPSRGGLIFDVTETGAGVEVFQPFELVDGADALAGTPTVLDGQSEIRLDIADLAPNQAIAFTIDVDDTLGQRAITVSGTEIEAARVSHSGARGDTSALFSASSEAELPIADC